MICIGYILQREKLEARMLLQMRERIA
jgi:hypothetical protein